jgi:hypothetical protein
MMCGHVFFYHDRHHLQRHRPVWQCGTCGRVSSAPLDCCPQPAFAPHHPPGLMHLLSQWASRGGRWMLATVRPLWGWQRHPATRAGTTSGTASPPNVVTAGVMSPPADGAESPAEDEVVVAAGERW